MAKKASNGKSKVRISKQATGHAIAKRNATTGQFVLGRSAFANISAVEGIRLSKGMKADFRRLEHTPADKRRSVLSDKYGKK